VVDGCDVETPCQAVCVLYEIISALRVVCASFFIKFGSRSTAQKENNFDLFTLIMPRSRTEKLPPSPQHPLLAHHPCDTPTNATQLCSWKPEQSVEKRR
jgi:hypothetical protein